MTYVANNVPETAKQGNRAGQEKGVKVTETNIPI